MPLMRLNSSNPIAFANRVSERFVFAVYPTGSHNHQFWHVCCFSGLFPCVGVAVVPVGVCSTFYPPPPTPSSRSLLPPVRPCSCLLSHAGLRNRAVLMICRHSARFALSATQSRCLSFWPHRSLRPKLDNGQKCVRIKRIGLLR